MLAITLGHLEVVTILLENGCSAIAENKNGWSGKIDHYSSNRLLVSHLFTVVQEATATGNANLLTQVLENRDSQRVSSRLHGIPALLNKLSEV